MIRRETYTIPAKESERTVEIRCDFCGRANEKPDDYKAVYAGNWAKATDYGTIDAVKIRRTKGSAYPGGGSEHIRTYDCCPGCWETKVEPSIRAVLLDGADAPRVEDRDS